MSYAPICLFAYNRADHLRETYASLTKCPEAKASAIYIFSDGAKNEASEAGVNEVRLFLKEVEDSTLFAETNIICQVKNKGLAASIIDGVTSVIGKNGKVIVLEDDCSVSPHFLRFMNGCLDTFENESDIGAIAGYAPVIKFPDNYTNDVFLARRSCSCGWATWKNRWDGVDWNMKRVNEFYDNRELLRRLNANGSDRFLRLYRQTKGNGSSWSVRFGAHLALNDWWVIYPRYSYIQNIGCDNSGVHSAESDAKTIAVDIDKAIPCPVLALPEKSEAIQKAMKRFYSCGLVSDIKRFIATSYIVFRNRPRKRGD